jgi:hypothetical protein
LIPASGSGAGAVLLVCVGLAALSVLVLPSVPSYDPWAWIVWGREISSATFTFATNGGPSWKPLPVAFTTVFGLFGAAAPKLWLIAARAGGLLALAAAYRLGTRLSGAVAGVLAAIALLLTQETVGTITQDWVHYLFRGVSEPMLVACALWGIERHLAGKRGAAFALGVGTALIRPEAWPFLGVYTIWLWRRDPRLRLLIVCGLAVIPLLWFGPPWISTHHPLAASTQAKNYNGHVGSDPFVTALRRGAGLVILPVLVAAAAALVLAWRDRRSEAARLTLWIGAGALAWVLLVAVMTVAGYPGLGRFMYPAAGVGCVLAGVGVARVAGLLGSGARFWGAVVLLTALCVPFADGRVRDSWHEKSEADLAVRFSDELSGAVAVAGGRARVVPCNTSVAAVNHTMQTELAWILHVRLSRVKTVLREPGVDFVGPHNATIDGAAAPIRIHGTVTRSEIASHGFWRVVRVTAAGGDARCVGG